MAFSKHIARYAFRLGVGAVFTVACFSLRVRANDCDLPAYAPSAGLAGLVVPADGLLLTSIASASAVENVLTGEQPPIARADVPTALFGASGEPVYAYRAVEPLPVGTYRLGDDEFSVVTTTPDVTLTPNGSLRVSKPSSGCRADQCFTNSIGFSLTPTSESSVNIAVDYVQRGVTLGRRYFLILASTRGNVSLEREFSGIEIDFDDELCLSIAVVQGASLPGEFVSIGCAALE